MAADEDAVPVPATETEVDEETVGAGLVALELDRLVILELDPLVVLVPYVDVPSASPVPVLPVLDSPVPELCVQ